MESSNCCKYLYNKYFYCYLQPGVSEAEPSRQPGSQAGTPRVTKPHQKKPLLYEYSPDGGAFLAAQPVPKCGAFCYLAVVSRGKSKE